MANADITYLKDASRFPKQTVTPVKLPRVQISADEYNRLVGVVSDNTDKTAQLASDVEIATEDAAKAKESARIAQSSALNAEVAARSANAALSETKKALESFINPDNVTENIAAQVVKNTGDISQLKEEMSNTAQMPTVSLVLNDDGDLILTRGDRSMVTGGELTDDGEVILNINIT